ncbi:hypothetical protein THAOC_08263 [Thalassiosira oceanica]|uniref:Uncharacterized protein n=1 Tax=Thalassiosira oceanica TaxID=159749 RepID=K0SVE9_THAOC|nr:hypothetical protein THAOC_08263 [Thalassiosira oceanica]|eukprot:EJK70383.1 hypothetical protein THAOC_08263 [Thalassiosira oceanica]
MRAESSAGVSAAAAKFVKVVRVHLLGRSPLLTRTEFNDQSIEDYVWRLCQAAANGLVPINCNDDMTPSKNTSLAKYELELAHYISETDSAVESCFKTLKESQSLSDKQHAAERIESALWLKMFELEEKTVQYNESRRKSCEKKFIGFGTRVRDYKKRIAMTMDKVPPKYNYPLVTLIGLEDLKRREQQQRTQMEETQMEEETQTDETRTEDTQAEATQRGATQRGAQVQGVRPLSDFGFNGDARQMNVERIARGFAERQQQQSKNAC